MKEHVYEYESIIVGNCVNALMLGFETSRPVLTLGAREPFFFERFDPKSNLSKFRFANETKTIKTPTGQIQVGIKKRDVYRKLSIVMSLAGLLPLSNQAVSMRRTDENTIKVILDHARSVKFKFENVVIFQNSLLEPENPPKYMVLDWMNVRSGMVHPFDRIEGTTPFVNCIHFHPSERIDGVHDKKDLVSVSYLTREQMNSYEFSDTYARFSVIDKMKKAGIRGARNGRDTKNPDRYKYYSVKAETSRRIAVPMYPEVSYFPSKKTSNKYLQYLLSSL
tara:strand:- start:1379 stop:2215 length:837 start_codon:yes stop_codon:yes gene_type:complete